MVDLVKILKGEVLVNSQLISDKFNKPHDRILKSIEKLKGEIGIFIRENSRVKSDEYLFKEVEREVRGRKFKSYEMNRNAFSLLAMGFTGKKALKWKIDFTQAFNLMEKTLSNKQSIEWNKQREQGKLARKSETDVIKNFVEYATIQGSKNANFYYKHLTSATYKALQLIQHKKPMIRETLDMLELNQLILAENIAMKSLEGNMKTGEHYKAIFVNVKNDIEKFASTLFLTNNKHSIT